MRHASTSMPLARTVISFGETARTSRATRSLTAEKRAGHVAVPSVALAARASRCVCGTTEWNVTTVGTPRRTDCAAPPIAAGETMLT